MPDQKNNTTDLPLRRKTKQQTFHQRIMQNLWCVKIRLLQMDFEKRNLKPL